MVTWLKNPFVLFLVTTASLFFVWSQLQTLQKTQTSTENLDVLEQEISKITSELSELQTATISSSLDFKQERIARNELLLSKPGETLLQLPVIEPSENQLPTPVATPKPFDAWLTLFSATN